MKVVERVNRKKQTLLEMRAGSVFLYPSSVEHIPDYVMLRVLGHYVKDMPNNTRIIAVRLEDGFMLAATDETLQNGTEYEIISDAEVRY